MNGHAGFCIFRELSGSGFREELTEKKSYKAVICCRSSARTEEGGNGFTSQVLTVNMLYCSCDLV